MEYKPTIGLEIHVELKTKTKMFCASLNDPEEKRPNVNICPVCMGHPGTLPVMNKEAVRKVLLVGKAIGGQLADYCHFDRKNYFYPDIPKGYQISQYKFPLVSGGELSGVEITRVHLEEDTGKLSHAEDKSSSLVDFNRAGVPLMELVTEPCINSAEEARRFAEELQLVLRYLGASDADMEKGQMRIEVNISLAPVVGSGGKLTSLRTDEEGNPTEAELSSASSGSDATQNFTLPNLDIKPDLDIKSGKLGTKVEVKNLNSFRSVERAIEYEIKRQTALLEAGEKVKHETRGWDEGAQKTFSQREKEMAHDYRYFPDPDLPPLYVSELGFDLILPELPEGKRKRFKEEYGLKDDQVEIFVGDIKLGNFFESAAKYLQKDIVSVAANYIISDLAGLMTKENIPIDDLKINPEMFAKLAKLAAGGEISSRGAKDVLKIMFEKGGDPEEIVKEKGLAQTSDDSFIKNIVEEVIKNNPSVAEDYKKGKENALQFLVGQGMKISKGSANPEALRKVLKERIAG
ncbi:aspartyl/glutamyl-tRNA amidotransferase subunit B [Candidatus Parcubacteria bacterium]|nr:MAG: aspartyl/glutamyl-tRNA amidotransferase subunit B [Candidatus Parcubacteria bacterium]